jgi:hypothetical protein
MCALDTMMTITTSAGLLREGVAGDPRLSPLADLLVASAAALQAHITARRPAAVEALNLADQLREWTRDDPRLAARTIRLRELLNDLLGDLGNDEVELPTLRDAYGREVVR